MSFLRKYFFLLSAAALFVPAAPGAPLRITIQLPTRADDGPSLVATVTLINTSGQPLTLIDPDAVTVRFRIDQNVDFGTRKWVQHVIGQHPLQSTHTLIQLAPEQSISARVPVLSAYPLGLAPGEYAVHAIYQLLPDVKGLSWYGSAESDPATITIAAPETPAYKAFLRASRAGAAHDPACASLALEFARLYPEHPYAAPLLVAVLSFADGTTATQITSFITITYPKSVYVIQAAALSSAVQQRETERAEYEQYTAAMKQYGGTHPEIREAAGHMLGTILDASGFDRAESFIRQYPDSPFVPEAIWSMINAVNNGMLPPGRTSNDRGRVLANLYRRLLRYPDNYWARRAARDPSVAVLLRQPE